MISVECPECGERFETEADALSRYNRFYCAGCDAVIEVVEEDPLVLEVVDEEFYDTEDEPDHDDWADE